MREFSILAAVTIICLQHVAAVQLRDLLGERKETETVCVSLVAYEEPEYIDALIENFDGFMEKGTKLAIHLNYDTNYNGTETRWESNRVTLSERRVAVKPFKGSIMMAHLLNARQMQKKWPNVCKYWVYQASNMMWARLGMEDMVRLHKYSPVGGKSDPGEGNCAADHAKAKLSEEGPRKTELPFPAFFKRLSEPKKLYGIGQPEGSYFPMKAVLGLFKMIDDYSREIDDHGEFVFNAYCDLESKWLQTYVLNFMDLPEDFQDTQRHEKWAPLCYSKIQFSPESIDEHFVDEVHKGDYEGYYAVKRVNRDVKHPVTKKLIVMSRAQKILAENRKAAASSS